MTEILDRIDDMLTFYSAGLGHDVTVQIEHDDAPWARLPVPLPGFPPDPEAVRCATDTMTAALNNAGAYIARFFETLTPTLQAFAKTIGPFVLAYDRHRRRLRVLHRFNRPELYADLWSMKTARSSRAWSTRQVPSRRRPVAPGYQLAMHARYLTQERLAAQAVRPDAILRLPYGGA